MGFGIPALIGAGTGLLAGIAGQGGGGAEAQSTELDPRTSELMHSLIQRGTSATPESVAKEQLQGVQDPQGLMDSSDLERRGASLGGSQGNPMMREALKNKYQKFVESGKNQLGRQAKQEAITGAIRKQQQAADLAQQFEQIRQGKTARIEAANAANEATRGQVLGSVLGAGGSLLGSYFGSQNKEKAGGG